MCHNGVEWNKDERVEKITSLKGIFFTFFQAVFCRSAEDGQNTAWKNVSK